MDRWLLGDTRQRLNDIEPGTVHTCVTSPPYYGLRDYGVSGQIGLEPTPDEYVRELVEVFRGVRRALRDDGTLWLNLGDSYNNRRRITSTSHQAGINGFEQTRWADQSAAGLVRMTLACDGLKERDMIGAPWKVALALRSDGWWLRHEIVWTKSFGKPEPHDDRLLVRHETIFLLSKSKRPAMSRSAMPEWAQSTVWSVPPTGLEYHGAAMPARLPEPCVLAGSPVGGMVLDPFGGAGTTALVARRLGRRFTHIELNPDYMGIAQRRLDDVRFQSSLFGGGS